MIPKVGLFWRCTHRWQIKTSLVIPILTIIIPSASRIVSILSILDFFAQSNCYTFLETLGYLETFQICLHFFFYYYFSTVYRPEQNDIMKLFFLDLYSSGQDTMLKFCTLTNTLKGCSSEKKSKWQPLCVFYRPKHDFTFLVCKIRNFDNFQFFKKIMYFSCTAEYLAKIWAQKKLYF